ncbi:hypothetical protein [Frigidibacter sp. SD6-1]|uniref:hypothetical protein n=1 Tax=Frigidibacter sp. SD6-1 TaxID=3032581 RepID=UPI0024DF5AF0|nr:hypothetical protein [Frigidibacter sp. SD6-1]
MRDEAESRAEAGKNLAAEQGQRFANDLRAEAGRRGNKTFQGQVLDTMANGVADLSEGLRGHSIASILQQAESFARRNPGAFVADAALAGFAVARFARASSQPDHPASPGEAAQTSPQDSGVIVGSPQKNNTAKAAATSHTGASSLAETMP